MDALHFVVHPGDDTVPILRNQDAPFAVWPEDLHLKVPKYIESHWRSSGLAPGQAEAIRRAELAVTVSDRST